MLKKILLLLCLFSLLLCTFGAAYAATVSMDAGEKILLHNVSPWYVANDVWLKTSQPTETDENGNLFISIDDFRTIFRCNISYNYEDLSIFTQHKGREIWQGLSTPVMFVDGLPYPNPAPYISSQSGLVMIPAEPYASVFGYRGTYVKTEDYAPGKLELTLPPHLFTISHIEVNQAMQMVIVYGTDAAGTTIPLKHFVCSTGIAPHVTPNGEFRARPLTYSNNHGPWYYFVDSKCWILYCTQISGNICFHSIPFNDYGTETLSQSGYAAIGKMASHGCIRLMVEDARFIWENCKGVPVIISDGFYDETLSGIKEGILRNRPAYADYVKSLQGNY